MNVDPARYHELAGSVSREPVVAYGHPIAREIAPLPGRPALLVMTRYGQPQDRVRAEEAGFDLHFFKPVSPEGPLVRRMTLRKRG